MWHKSRSYEVEPPSDADANRGTIEALQKSGLIAVAKDGRVLNPTVAFDEEETLTGTLRRAGSILTGVGRPTAGA